MTDQWRYACPTFAEHRTVSKRGNKTNSNCEKHWYCATCNERYTYVIDKKTGDKITV
jgi:hypothetical protein